MKHIKYITLVITFSVIVLFASCGDKHTEKDGHNHNEESSHSNSENEENEEHQEESLHLTKEQIEIIGLEFGDFSAIKVNDFVKAIGKIGLPPNSYSNVSAKMAGIIKINKRLVEGEYIKKGSIIGFIENLEIIVKQQDYLKAKAELKLKRLDLKRQQSLLNANAGVSKNLQNVEAEVAILHAKTMGLSKQLSYLGISPKTVSPNAIKQQIAVVAPMSGFISTISIHNGMYVQPSISLMEIISDKHIHLELDVFEKDIDAIKLGQKISYIVPALDNTIYAGEINVIGKEFNSQSKTVRVHGHLEGTKPIFLKDLFINAKIWLNDATTNSLPEKAIISDGTNSFVYVAKKDENADEIEFTKINVIEGASNDGFTAIKLLNKIPDGMKIVTKGAYYVYAQSKVGEL